MRKGLISRLAMLIACAVCVGGGQALAASGAGTIGINVALKTDATNALLADLGKYGTVKGVIQSIDAVAMQASESRLPAIRALSYVAAANPDRDRLAAPVDTVTASDFANGFNTWDLDAVNVTDRTSAGRKVAFDGTGVLVAVLDTGLLKTWRQYFPEQRIAEEFGVAFGGGGGDNGDNVSTPTNKWEQDTNSHGTHVTSTILGYSLNGTPINGVAPKATVIPVKVLNQNGSGQSSMVAAGIVYVADLKKSGQLGNAPVVINMSLGGPELDAVEKAAIDYAVANGVIIVASAGNSGDAGMGFPGAYAPVVSVAASGWINEWQPGADGNPLNWWNADDVADPTAARDFYITDFSSRALTGQDLDVSAPGSWVVGPFQLSMGKTSYFFLGGTSMASPHVAGIAALMAQKRPTLTPAGAESILTSSAIPMAAGCRMVRPGPGLAPAETCWGANATGHGLATANAALAATR